MTRMRKRLPLLAGAAIAICLFIGLQLISYVRYENSDDILIVKSFMGFEGGVPARFNLYLHTLLSYLLGFLSTVLPNIAWFSLLQLFCLWLSAAVIAKCVMECAASGRASPWAGLLLALLFSGVICAFACARVNFTTTAALLGAAAVAELITLADIQRRASLRAAFSVLLLLGCYLIRPQSFVAALPFWLLALAWLCCARKASRALPRSFFVTLAAGALCLLVLTGVRWLELQDPALKALDEFQTANLGPMDYGESELLSVPDEVLDEIGWSRAELALVRQWYFMDENITADAFNRLNAAMAKDASLPERVGGAIETVIRFYAANARYLFAALFLLALCLLCVALPGAAGGANQKRAAFTPLAAALCVLGAVAMLLYLAIGGRFLARAADCALFPAAAMLCCLAAACLGGLPAASQPRRAVALGLCSLALCCAAVNLAQTKRVLSDRPDTVSATRESDLEAFALNNPDRLILRTPDLLRDTRILPDVSGGMPVNLMIWGDWYCRTPSWYAQLERFGFDGHAFTASDFLRENLLFVTAEDAPPETLLQYIAEEAQGAVAATLYGTRGELKFFSFSSSSVS